MSLLSISPKAQYTAEIKNGGINAQKKLQAYFNKTYLKDVYNNRIRVNELKLGQIYTYRYNPKYKDILSYYDRNPLVLIYSSWYAKDNTYLYNGINLHFLPTIIKLEILDSYWRYFYRFGGQKIIKVLPVTYMQFFDNIFKKINKINYKFALRTYIVNNVWNSIQIPESDWGKMILLKPMFINGVTLDEIYKQYYKYNKK